MNGYNDCLPHLCSTFVGRGRPVVPTPSLLLQARSYTEASDGVAIALLCCCENKIKILQSI